MRIPTFAKNPSKSEAAEIARWWSQLEPRVRAELGRDRGRPPAGVVARFVEPGAEEEDGTEFPQDHYEYVVAHGAYFHDFRPFHICSAHPAARAAIAKGRIPADFVCPRSEEQCPMRAALAREPGRDLLLTLHRKACS